MSAIRWVALRVVTGQDGTVKASDVLGQLSAPDIGTARFRAVELYGGKNLSVVSLLSWEMSQDERRRLDKRAARPVIMSQLMGRGGTPRKFPL